MPSDSLNQRGQTVGARLRAARQAKKYTQNQLARPDFSVSYISAIERSQIQPSLRALEILAQRLGLSARDLIPSPEQMARELSMTKGSGATADMERELLLLEAQIHIHRGNPEQAIDLLRPFFKEAGEKHREVAARYILGRAFLERGLLQESEQLLMEAARRAREAKDPLYPCILGLQVAVYTAMHNAEQAAQAQRAGLAFLEQQAEEPEATKNGFFLAQLYTSLGQYYIHQEQIEKAAEMFAQALATLRDRTSYQDLPAVYSNLAQVYKEKEEYLLAALNACKSLLADFQAGLMGVRSRIQHTLGRASLESAPDEAYAYLSGLAQEGSGQHDPLSQASACVHLASWFIEHNRLDEAELYSRQAWELAEPFGQTIIGADALFLRGELAYRHQDGDTGEQCFESGLLMLERLEEEERLVKYLTRYAQLLEENGSIHKAVIYWKRAYENSQRSRTIPL